MLTIFGVIMFMLSGFVVGQAGVWAAVGMVALASGITFLTGLSISAISTNTAVRGGGAYFLISRSLGPEFGGAIGLALYAAQALSVPFYVLGFVEALTRAFPAAYDYYFSISLLTASVILVLAYFGAEWAIRVQYGIFAVLIVAIISFMSGGIAEWDAATFAANTMPTYTEGHDYWIVFAIFFPAVTGIMAGVNMSGDLKDPGRSLPLGTLAAVAVGFVVYVAQMIVIGGSQERTAMIERPFETLLSQAMFGIELPVILGVFAATVSSAIGSIVGAPRILQALARDEAFPILKPFAKGSGDGDEPRNALVLTALMTFGILLLAGGGSASDESSPLVVMAAIITMFFLYTYGMCNLAAFVESVSQNPSFRPRFRFFHWTTGLLGTLGCVGAAMLIDPIAAVVAVAIIIGIYFYVRTRVLDMAFGDARRGFIYSRVRNYLLTLRGMRPHPKNWRPTILAFSGNPATRLPLIEFAQWLEAGRGLVTLATVVQGDFERDAAERDRALDELSQFIRDNDVSAFPEVVVSPQLDTGIEVVLQAHSIGPIKPNVVLMGWSEKGDRAARFSRRLRAARALGMSLLTIYRCPSPAHEERRVDIWWRGQENGHLMAILAHLLINNHQWRGTRVRVLRHIGDETLREEASAELHRLREAARVDFEVVVVADDLPSVDVIHRESGDARLVMLGFSPPDADDSEVWHASTTRLLAGLPTTMLVCSTGEADLFA